MMAGRPSDSVNPRWQTAAVTLRRDEVALIVEEELRALRVTGILLTAAARGRSLSLFVRCMTACVPRNLAAPATSSLDHPN